MVALFVVPAFCTKSGYIYKNKGGGATQSEPNQKQTAIVKCKESDTGANYTFRIKSKISWVSKKLSFGRWSVRWDNHEELIQAGGAAR